MINKLLSNIPGSAGMIINSRIGCKELWDQTFNSLPYKSVAYSNTSLDYQLAYQQGHGGSWFDFSSVIYSDNKPVALWPLTISIKDNAARLTSQGSPVLAPVFLADCPAVSRKRIIKICIELANALAIAYKISEWESGESFSRSIGMSEWHIQSMGRDSLCHVFHELYIDLGLDIAEIKRNFRKRFKSLVVSGSKLWAVGVLDGQNDGEIWSEFRDLHHKVSGRVTRSDETWMMQYQDILFGRAFLVWLRNSCGEMVGGGLFNFTDDEGVYAVGAYDRTLFDKPLGHVVQYRAIEELKKRNVSWYKIGVRPYASDNPKPTEKEISIGEFKQGFSSHCFPHYRLTHRLVQQQEV
ncbi:MAG: FemAB family protein [Chlorobium sp.]